MTRYVSSAMDAKPCVVVCEKEGRSPLSDYASFEVIRRLKAAHAKQENQVFYYDDASIHMVVDSEHPTIVNIVFTRDYTSENFVHLNQAALDMIGDAFAVTSKPLFTKWGEHRPLYSDVQFKWFAMRMWLGAN